MHIHKCNCIEVYPSILSTGHFNIIAIVDVIYIYKLTMLSHYYCFIYYRKVGLSLHQEKEVYRLSPLYLLIIISCHFVSRGSPPDEVCWYLW